MDSLSDLTSDRGSRQAGIAIINSRDTSKVSTRRSLRLIFHVHIVRCLMLSGAALFLSQITSAQSNLCTPTSYVNRAAGVPKPPSWKIAGSYESFTTTMGLGSVAADINGDGRLELLSSGVGGTVWQAIGFAARNNGYEIIQSARLPYPFGINEGGSGVLSFGTLTTGGASKVFSNTPLRIYDAATQKLELVSDSAIGNGRLYGVDLNDNGNTELVGEGGAVVDGGLTHYLSTGINDGTLLGHFDSLSAYEIVGLTGALYQWQGAKWTQTANLNIQSDHDIVVASGDLNGNGLDDFVYESNGSQLTAYDFANKQVLWQITATSIGGTSTNAIRAITIADANGDGKPDVLVVTDGAPNDLGEVRAYDGRTGTELWSFQHPDGVGTGIVVGNFDDDPAPEIVVGTSRPVTGPDRLWVYDLTSRTLKWQQRQEVGPVRAMAIGALTAGPGEQIIVAPTAIVGEGDTIFHIRDVAAMAPLTDLPSAKLPAPTRDGVEALAFGDVIGDSAPELVVGTDDSSGVSSVYVYSWPNQTLLQSFALDPGTIVVDLAIADLANTGQQQIIAATAFEDTRSTGTRLYILDAHSGSLVWSSGDLFTQFGITNGLKVVDLLGDGHPKILASGQDMAIIDGATHQVTHIPGTVFGGFDVADVDGDGVLDIVGGTGAVNGGNAADEGHLVVLKGPNWTKSIDLKVCGDMINAVRWNSLNTARHQVFYTCGSQLGMADLDSQTWQTVSAPAALALGIQNHLFLLTTPAGDPRLVASGQFGSYSFVQTANIAPYADPANVCSPFFFATHWGPTLQGSLSYFDSDGDLLTFSVVQSTKLGNTTVGLGGGFETISYTAPSPVKGTDLLTTQVSDGTDVSPLALSTILLTNEAPTIGALSFTVAAGQTYSGGIPGSDGDLDALTYNIVQSPTVGTLTLTSNGSFTFTAPADASGTTTFSVAAFDQIDYSTPSIVTVQITAPTSTGSGGGSGSSGKTGSGGGGAIGHGEIASLMLLALLAIKRRSRLQRRRFDS